MIKLKLFDRWFLGLTLEEKARLFMLSRRGMLTAFKVTIKKEIEVYKKDGWDNKNE